MKCDGRVRRSKARFVGVTEDMLVYPPPFALLGCYWPSTPLGSFFIHAAQYHTASDEPRWVDDVGKGKAKYNGDAGDGGRGKSLPTL